jgi:hypothetical protein
MSGKFPSTGWFAMGSAAILIVLLLTLAITWMKRSEL